MSDLHLKSEATDEAATGNPVVITVAKNLGAVGTLEIDYPELKRQIEIQAIFSLVFTLSYNDHIFLKIWANPGLCLFIFVLFSFIN